MAITVQSAKSWSSLGYVDVAITVKPILVEARIQRYSPFLIIVEPDSVHNSIIVPEARILEKKSLRGKISMAVHGLHVD